ncbi:hypothetical protein COY07_06360 [Candidatus Peregrinibacteria bacterium CG_4_10_14_0_2_um_filter_43_11]|nr:MAG: hypothetical protein COY07_06360 [Candidatus Peregrinibacteria bacterium CG_4_10_14_0_2_um_filter_43_11]
MKKQTNDFLKYVIVPVVILAIFAIVAIIYHLFNLPSYAEMKEWIKDAFAIHGYSVVFLGALAEGILLANWYLPGSVVMVMGVVFAKSNGMNPILVIGLIILGFLITTVFNYALGRYGWYRLLLKFGLRDAIERTKKRVKKQGLKIIFVTYFHPNVGALTATCAGILKLPFQRFFIYSLSALISWNVLWGMVVYISGPAIVEIVNFKNLLLILLAWVVVLLFQFIRMQQRKTIPIKIHVNEMRNLLQNILNI